MLASNATVIPVAAGKGGVGKTQIAANLAIALAQAGKKTIVVDLDLGGSNLHTHLGLPNRNPGLGDYLRTRKAELDELLVDTGVPGLQFIPGDARSPFMANIAYQQKRRLLRHLRALEADYLVLDLSAGASFNSLDFFALAPSGLLVTQAEFPSIMNMLSFLKQFVSRRIGRNAPRITSCAVYSTS
jgi:flagellar biosynthesis protein FlhG